MSPLKQYCDNSEYLQEDQVGQEVLVHPGEETVFSSLSKKKKKVY